MKLDDKYTHPGEFLKENRLSKKLSLRGLSSIAGISHTEISKIENGEREHPSSSTLFKICNALELDYYSIADLFGINPVHVDSNSDNKAMNKAKSRDLEYYGLVKICEEISNKYGIDVTPDKLTLKHRVGGKCVLDYVYFGDKDLVIGIDVKVVSSSTHPYLFKLVKSNFADFYFSFSGHRDVDDLDYFVVFVCEDEFVFSEIHEVYKAELYRFGPVLSSRIYLGE
ncbi:helix-turn-helix domain-containing protein [Romboutsia sp. Marseille-P6047]|uniref:helix-turn-helix domain-containing protein n=1 Tax=Romboutsia sp. Marseille-P6047 TaxID=2161817 RepID=UPI000F06317D|nr:helix-turn-helix transcriptional regulator [Romboutsia sp. Marseille-P6047]